MLAAIHFHGWWSWVPIVFVYMFVPLGDQVLPISKANWSDDEEQMKSRQRVFDWLLYLNLPLYLPVVAYYLFVVTHQPLALWEIIGLTLSMGMMVGTIGINVAHELGHRSKAIEQAMAELLLTTALYTHFIIEHNRGHHKTVATPEDPASARFGESLYAFWWRSIIGQYRHAWDIEAKLLIKKGYSFISWSNRMIRLQCLNLGYLALVYMVFGWQGVGFATLVAIIGIQHLETVNYLEHYGLTRKKLDTGIYEKVSPVHSWNSDHPLGRIFLYELSRHSDHHYKASRKYQILRHLDNSPQLPLGYPASLLMALIPPLWFRIMNRELTRQVG